MSHIPYQVFNAQPSVSGISIFVKSAALFARDMLFHTGKVTHIWDKSNKTHIDKFVSRRW